MKRWLLCSAALAGMLVAVAGCGKAGKPAEPKLGAGVKEDPRLKPGKLGSGPTNVKSPLTTP